jgi:membrane fusion protein, multidrug efflux system
MHEVRPTLDGEPSTGHRLRRTLTWIAVLLLVLGGTFWWFHRRSEQQQAQGQAAAGGASATGQAQGGQAQGGQGAGAGGRRGGAGGPPPPVAVATAATGDIKVTLNALGTVTPLATVTVQSQISGQLTQIAFREGQRVKKGDFLAQIDPRPYQAALDQAQGQLAKDQASLQQAQMDYTRYLNLAEKNSIARQQAEDQQWLVHQDEGQVKVDQAQVETAQLNLVYCRIISPADGRIGLRLVDQGNYVQASATGTGIAVITQTQPITVVFVLAEDNLPQVLKRMHAGASLPVAAYDRSGATLLDTGALAAIDSQINTSTGTVNLKAQFANAEEILFPNQFVNTILTVDEMKGVTTMPTAAIQRGAPGTFVYKVTPDSAVALQVVKLGPIDGDKVAVLSGLAPGDRIVIDGADKLRDGAKIVVRGDGAANATASGTAATPADAATNNGAPASNGAAPADQPKDDATKQHGRRKAQSSDSSSQQ